MHDRAFQCGPRTALRRTGVARRAFTLIEILIVLVVMVLLGSTAVSRYSGALNNFGADALARRVAADLAYAQSIARRTGVTQSVSFDTANNQYQLVGWTDPDRPGTTYGLSFAAEPYRGKVASLTLTTGSTAVTQVNFDQYGFPDAGGTIVVQVGDVQKTVTLNATSGKTLIQ
jgi:prepilin-type N-terminal cleavage/methylation domain-containing protein